MLALKIQPNPLCLGRCISKAATNAKICEASAWPGQECFMCYADSAWLPSLDWPPDPRDPFGCCCCDCSAPYITMKYVRPNGWPAKGYISPPILWPDPSPRFRRFILPGGRRPFRTHTHTLTQGRGHRHLSTWGQMVACGALPAASAQRLFPEKQPVEGGVNG